ncbi:MAG: hypothetical protein RLZZ440_1890 [Planctomycetota bacterium]|jgi:antitoxin (DNA-binding transcriptional repressor) of toxin-antitoxin stability system
MKRVSFTDFRMQASALFDAVERGEHVVVLRHGKPVAEIRPVVADATDSPSWRRAGPRLVTKGAGLSSAILGERGREDVF